jgi:predicted RNA-binding protein
MRTTKVIAAAAFALLVVAACSSSGGYGDIFGTNSRYDIRGTVDSVDLNSRSIWLINTSSSLASGGSGGNAVRVYYDDRTTVSFNGRSYRPQDLERGDEVTVHASQSGNQVVAESMDVTYNAHGSMTSSGSSYPSYPSSNLSTIRGTVRSIDTYNHTITLEGTSWVSGFRSTTSGSVRTLSYDTNVRVDYNGQLYPIANLERGDVVDVQMANNGSNFVQSIVVVRDVNR